MRTGKIPFIANLALTLVSLIALGYLLVLGQSIIAPFFFAFLLAMLFRPLAQFLEEKLRFPRLISTFTCVLIIITLLVGLSFFFSSELSDFSKDIPHLKDQFSQLFHDSQTWVNDTFHINADTQFDYLNKGLDKLLSSSGAILGFTLNVFSASLGFFSFCIIFFVFILAYRRVLYDFIVSVFADKHVAKVKQAVTEIENMMKSYLIGVCIQIIIVSILASVILSILGVKYAILIGVLSGLLNVIPYIGIAISGLIACLFAFATNSPITCLYAAMGYIGIHLIDGNIILPFVVRSKVKINALFTFIGIIVGASLWGISGMFLCIPAMAIFKIISSKSDNLEPWGAVLGEGKS